MSMRYAINQMKNQPTRRKTFNEARQEAEAYEASNEFGTAAVMWNVAEGLAETTEQREMAMSRRRENSQKGKR